MIDHDISGPRPQFSRSLCSALFHFQFRPHSPNIYFALLFRCKINNAQFFQTLAQITHPTVNFTQKLFIILVIGIFWNDRLGLPAPVYFFGDFSPGVLRATNALTQPRVYRVPERVIKLDFMVFLQPFFYIWLT